MLAIHPDQVPVINAAFMPGAEEIAESARASSRPSRPVRAPARCSSKAEMLDQPHLEQARLLLDGLR